MERTLLPPHTSSTHPCPLTNPNTPAHQKASPTSTTTTETITAPQET